MGTVYGLTLNEKAVLVGNDTLTVRTLEAKHDVRFLIRVLAVVAGELGIANDIRKIQLTERWNGTVGQEGIRQDIL